MRNLFFITSSIILIYLVYYQGVYFYSYVIPEEPQYNQFVEYLPLPITERMREIRFMHLMLSLLSGITFLLYVMRSRGSNTSKNVVKVVLAVNILISLLFFWQVLAHI